MDNSGSRQYFKLKLNNTDEGGKIYRVASGKTDELVGKIKSVYYSCLPLHTIAAAPHQRYNNASNS
jgi:hypothetical protein